MPDLKAKPFYLNDKQIMWVEDTLKSMNLNEKIGQLFLVIGLSDKEEDILKLYDDTHFGGIMYRPEPAERLKNKNEKLQKHAKIPVLIAANLESGGSGAILEGTAFGSQLQIGATGEKEQAYQLGKSAPEKEKQ